LQDVHPRRDTYQRQKESGLTVKEFCSNELIAPSTFYYWQKKMRNRKRLPDFIPVVVNSMPDTFGDNLSNGTLIPPALHQKESSSIEIEFPNKTIVRIKSEVNLSVLKALIHIDD